jgi:hypothetical protein
MAPKLSEDEIDDLVYLARTGDDAELNELLSSLAERESASTAEVLLAAKDEGKSTTLHMATGNGHVGKYFSSLGPERISKKYAASDCDNRDCAKVVGVF